MSVRLLMGAVWILGCNGGSGDGDAGPGGDARTPGADGATGGDGGPGGDARVPGGDGGPGEDGGPDADAGPGGDGGAPPADAGFVCDCPEDDDPCTVAGCDADGNCIQEAGDVVCDDGQPCTADRCVLGPICVDGSDPVDGACAGAVAVDEAVGLLAPGDARAACRADGADLDVPVDAAANARIRAAADVVCGAGAPALVGVVHAGAGTFETADGQPLAFEAWAAGQPALPAEGDAFVVALADGTWTVTAEPIGCFVCAAGPVEATCLHDPVENGEPELCNGVDDDCDGLADEGDALDLCDDGDACTDDICAGADGCQHPDVSAVRCDDAVACTVDTCDPQTGCAHAPQDARCDDGVACTVERCDAMLGCTNTPDDGACDDGQACTTETCDAIAGCQYVADDAACDDGVDCTDDRCAPFDGCTRTPRNGACDDENPCTDDLCDPAMGCVRSNNEAVCDDGEPCSVSSRCRQGRCVQVTPLVCDDRAPCTRDACMPGVGCVAPPDAECRYPGPVGGFYEGPFEIDGGEAITPLGEFRWGCSGVLGVVIDASRPVEVYGLGEVVCDSDSDGFLFELGGREIYPTVLQGRVEGDRVVGTFTLGDDTGPWAADIEYDAQGVPVRLVGVSESETTLDNLPIQHPLIEQLIDIGLRQFEVPFGLVYTLDRQAIRGTCSGPGGTEETLDHVCHARGWDFAPRDAGRCCDGAECTVLTESACDRTGGSFVAARYGACCGAVLACEPMNALLCELRQGVTVPGLGCGDGDGDGLADACPVPADFGYDLPPDCPAPVDGRLTMTIAPGVSLTMVSDWSVVDGSYEAGDTLSIVTPLGDVMLPDVLDLRVGCGDRFSIQGRLGAPPGLGGITAWPSTSVVEANTPELVFGYGYGYELEAEELEGPFSPGRPYLYAGANTGANLSLGENITLDIAGGDSLTIAIDPTDPAFIFEVGGDLLSNAAGGLVSKAGMGMSRGGNLSWRSAVELFDGENFSQAVASGHVWRSGDFALIPIPNLPANINVEGEVLVDAGEADEYVEAIGRALVAGNLDDLRDALASAGDARNLESLVRSFGLAGNVNALHINVGPLDFTVGRGAFQYKNERFAFAGEGFSIGELLADSEVFEALSAVTIRQAGAVSGFMHGDRFHFEFTGSMAAGPFQLEDARLVVDSETGVRIEGGQFGMDFGAFLDQLLSIMNCEFDADGATCFVLGIEVADFEGSLDDSGFALDASMAVPLLAEVEFSARVSEDGSFALRGAADVGLAGFQTQEVVVSLSDTHFAASTRWAQFTQSIALAGRIGFDGTFHLQGSGAITVLGFRMIGVDVQLGSETGLRAEGSMQMPAGLGQQVQVVMTVSPRADDWQLEGTGRIAPLGFELGQVRVEAEANAAGAGLSVSGRVGIAGAGAMLNGRIQSNGDFSLTGRADLRVGSFDIATATVTLDPTGLRVAGMLQLLGVDVRLSGEVEANGDFLFATDGRVNVPLFGLNVNLDAQLQKRGANIEASGDVSLRFAGLNFTGDFTVRNDGYFSLRAGVRVTVNWWRVRGSGSCSFTMNSGGFGARFAGDLCVSVPVVSDPCVGASGSISSAGKVCVGLPVVGRRCVQL